MWPETVEALQGRMRAVNEVAERYDRTLDYGLRSHVIVRDTEAEAREYADYIISKLDEAQGEAIRNRALDAKSLGSATSPRTEMTLTSMATSSAHMWTG